MDCMGKKTCVTCLIEAQNPSATEESEHFAVHNLSGGARSILHLGHRFHVVEPGFKTVLLSRIYLVEPFFPRSATGTCKYL
jgi:hypothetical protein